MEVGDDREPGVSAPGWGPSSSAEELGCWSHCFWTLQLRSCISYDDYGFCLRDLFGIFRDRSGSNPSHFLTTEARDEGEICGQVGQVTQFYVLSPALGGL